MKHSSHGCMEHNHADSIEHDIHSILHPTHDAFNELLKDRIKSKLQEDPAINTQIEELSDIAASVIADHLQIIVKDIKQSLEENQDAHHS